MKSSPTTARRRFAGLVAAGMLAGSALAVTAPVAPASAVDNLRTCTTQGFISDNKLQWGTFTLCASTSTGSPQSTVSYTVEASDLKYLWGGIWYSNSYSATMFGNATLERDGRTVGSRSLVADTGGDSMTAAGSFTVEAAGTYTVRVQVDVFGMYWSESDGSDIQTEPMAASVVVAV